MGAFRVVVEPDLQRNEPLLSQVNALEDPALFPVPEVQPSSILAGLDVLQLEAGLKRLGGSPLAADHHVMSGLIPEVVIEVHPRAIRGPRARNLEVVAQQQEAAGPVPLLIAEHGNHDPSVGQAMDRMGAVSFVLLTISAGSMTLCSFGCRGSAVSTI